MTKITYKDAGVNTSVADLLVQRIAPLAAATRRLGSMDGIGGFGAKFEIPLTYKNPVLVSGTDGVGTKVKLATEWGMHFTIGIDLVAMSVNDILTTGAEPLFFLDYFACSQLDLNIAHSVVTGIAEGCRRAGCALIGGETSEMPGMYSGSEYDLAGFAVGVVEKYFKFGDMKAGDIVLGLASSGPHSNGYSLIRKCIASGNTPKTLDGMTFKDAIMEPTRIYVNSILRLLKIHEVKGLAHITGGGLTENIPRVVPDNLAVRLDGWETTELFDWLKICTKLSRTEMNTTFNNGIGMVVIVSEESAEAVINTLRTSDEIVHIIGDVIKK